MSKILISACLCGENCKYNGGNNLNDIANELVKNGNAIMVCPEVDGGLSTPRKPAELVNGRVLTKEGLDVTNEYNKGAQLTLKAAQDNDVELAILQERSPSCGSGYIYDGTHSGTLIKGMGITTELLRKNSIEVITIDEYIKRLTKS